MWVPSAERRSTSTRLILVAALMLVLGLAGLVRPATAATPGLSVRAPAADSTSIGSDVTVEFQVTDFAIVPSTIPLAEAGQHPEVNRAGEGHLHLTLDLGQVVVWDRAEPYVFTAVPTGEHVLMVELAENDHAPLTPPVMQEVRFRTVAGAVMPRTGGTQSPGASLPRAALALAVLGGLLMLVGQRMRRVRARR
jgi:hypothetical protein